MPQIHLAPQPITNKVDLQQATQMVEKLFMKRSLVVAITNVQILSVEHHCIIISCTIISKSRNKIRVEVALIEEEGE